MVTMGYRLGMFMDKNVIAQGVAPDSCLCWTDNGRCNVLARYLLIQ